MIAVRIKPEYQKYAFGDKIWVAKNGFDYVSFEERGIWETIDECRAALQEIDDDEEVVEV